MVRTLVSLIALLARLVIGLASVFVVWFVLDEIHDRNTEIVVACVGMLYCFVFLISRRWQYHGLSVFSLFGITVSRLMNEPYDQALHDEVGLPRSRTYIVMTIVFVAATELLCAFRLFTSLIGHGWDRFAAPIRAVVDWPQIEALLRGF